MKIRTPFIILGILVMAVLVFDVFLPNVNNTQMLVGMQDETKELYDLFPEDSVYHINIRWDEMQPKEDGAIWYNLKLRTAAQAAHDRNLKLILGTRTSPEWAREREFACSQPKPEYWSDYADYVNQVISFLHPWGIEIWNEPDATYDGIQYEWWWFFGCWDSPQSYSDFVHYVVPLIRKEHPETKILVGALALDNLNGYTTARLIDGMGDYLSFHSYSYYGANDNDRFLKKIKTLRDMGISSPLFMTETSLLKVNGDCLVPGFEPAKTEYAKFVALSDLEKPLAGRLWYTAGGNGWRCSDATEAVRDIWFLK